MDAKAATQITPEIVAEHGLTPDEYQRLLEILGRTPSLTELGIFSVMWSEHCSYKSSRVWLSQLPKKAPRHSGPGENAGIVDTATATRSSSRWRATTTPSSSSRTKARPRASAASMRDDSPWVPGRSPTQRAPFRRSRPSQNAPPLAGVVAASRRYANCTGVQRSAARPNFDAGYNGNILVNAMCVGLAKADRSSTPPPGRRLARRICGSKTGATASTAHHGSAEFDDHSGEATDRAGRRPFTENC